eukprot:8365513-Alexandrium_andersonii.AAC.1
MCIRDRATVGLAHLGQVGEHVAQLGHGDFDVAAEHGHHPPALLVAASVDGPVAKDPCEPQLAEARPELRPS